MGKQKNVLAVEDTTKEKHQVASTQGRGVFAAATSPMGKRGGQLASRGRAKGKKPTRGPNASTSVAQPRGKIEFGGARNLDVWESFCLGDAIRSSR